MANKQTPMMQQYQKIKEKYQDAFLFFRLGDFYELFFEDAIEAARILEITLTTRNKNDPEPIPMCGVPYHSAKDYIHRLIDEGHKVAICEQVEDPKLTKGMVKREVVRVITPGTILEDDALISKENNYLAYLTVHGDRYYLIYGDLSTGELNITNHSQWPAIFNELLLIQPSELLLDGKLDEEKTSQLREQLITYYSTPEDLKPLESDIQLLDNPTEEETETLAYFMAYIESVQFQAANYLQPVKRYEIHDYLQMNHYAKAQLELTKSLRTQRKKGSLLWLLDRTKTAMGGRLLHQWIDKPLMNPDEIKARHQRVECLLTHYFERVDILTLLERVYDLERLVTKISLNTANGRDLDQLRQSLTQIPTLNQLLSQMETEGTAYFPRLNEFSELLQTIETALIDEPPISLTEGNLIRDGYHEDLDRYRDALKNGQQWLQDLQIREREKTGLKTLKVGFNKVFGYYIEISRLQASQFEDPRFERKQTLANSERFITDELKEIETTILEAQEKSTQLEYELFVQLREEVSRYSEGLQHLAQQIAALDVYCTFAMISEEDNYVRATIAEEPYQLSLTASRHPVVEKLIGRSEFVANDFSLDEDNYIAILTGPNMSGKSTFMRQIAYAIILNQMGCFVPAKAATLPIIDKIFTRIGSADDISIGQSTFMVEMMEANLALQEATPHSLLLFDEIGRGTATYDGMALAQGIIEYTAKEVKGMTIFSTHYHELTQLAKDIPTVMNIHVGATEQDGELIFLHRILPGPADKSYGIHVAKLAGLPPSLIENSQHILADLELKAKKGFSDSEPTDTDSEKDGQDQVSSLTQAEAAVLEQLKSLNINQLTPIEALNILSEITEQFAE